jgi:hypothetical protein
VISLVTSASGSERSKHDCGPSTGKEGVRNFSMTKTRDLGHDHPSLMSVASPTPQQGKPAMDKCHGVARRQEKPARVLRAPATPRSTIRAMIKNSSKQPHAPRSRHPRVMARSRRR